jgi:RNA polymerase sigma factor (sigma-70 family)
MSEEVKPIQKTDFELLRAYVERKSQAAFNALYDRFRKLAYTICRSKLRNHHMAEEATQKVFVALIEKANSITPGPLDGYIARLALRISTKMANARRTWTKHKEKYREARRVAHLAEPPDERVYNLERFVSELQTHHQQIVRLHFEKKLGIDELMAATGLKREAIKKRLQRCLQDLRLAFRFEENRRWLLGTFGRALALMSIERHLGKTRTLERILSRALEVCSPDVAREHPEQLEDCVIEHVWEEIAAWFYPPEPASQGANDKPVRDLELLSGYRNALPLDDPALEAVAVITSFVILKKSGLVMLEDCKNVQSQHSATQSQPSIKGNGEAGITAVAMVV